MLRLTCGSLCLALAALVQFYSSAAGQEQRHVATNRGPLAERFGRLRRSLVGEEDPTPQHVHTRAPKSAPPRLTSQSVHQAQPSSTTNATKSITSSSDGASSSRRTAMRSQPDETVVSSSDGEPTLAEAKPTQLRADDQGAPDEDESAANPLPVAQPQKAPAKAVHTEKKAPAGRDDHGGTLFTRTMPQITLRASGPKRLDVGQAGEFHLVLANEGEQAANDVVVMVSLPETAELASTLPSTGTVDRAATGTALQWAIRKLTSGKREELTLRIVPHDSAKIDLDVRCGCAGIAATAKLDVQEARLALHINGATEVLCGEKEIYRLSVSNSGNGPAENTVIHLLPLPPEDGAPATHRLGTLAAGETKTVEIELVARQGGKLSIQARATADGGLNVAAAEDVTVRQPIVQVEVVGPARQYAGAPATYRVRVRNPGDAPARRVKIAAILPEGAECVAASHDGKIDVKHARATWSLSSLAAGAEQLFTVKCLVKTPGENRLEAVAEADGGLKHTNLATTEVIAVADLVLDISDPSGAVPIGQDSVYEVRVRNRGDRAADGVEITAQFSKGVEPVAVDGAAHSVSAAGVVFETIPSLGPGQEKSFTIHAKGAAAGVHRFRVELQCKSLGTRLTEEETTLYYADLPADKSSDAESVVDQPAEEAPHVAAPKRVRSVR
ncbi:MAG TPA: hypothetical protein VFI31_19240 [Pirellulales bacterium]|nr:hypothetical protein [Pirellulales bacterium]